jgi:hypothetical protein
VGQFSAGANSPSVRKVHQNYYLATTTAMTVVLFEEMAEEVTKVIA